MRGQTLSQFCLEAGVARRDDMAEGDAHHGGQRPPLNIEGLSRQCA